MKGRKRRPFLVTPEYSPYAFSRTMFRRLPRDRKLELMREWFDQHFKRPEELLPRDEGDWVWVYGDACHPHDELSDKFGGLVDDAAIETVADDLTSDGTVDWSPVPDDDFYGRSDDDKRAGTQALSTWLKNLPDEPGSLYDTPADMDGRRRAINALDDLEAAATQSAPSFGIGHNQPPEPIAHVQKGKRKRKPTVVRRLQAELIKPKPQIPTLKRLTATLARVGRATVRGTAGLLKVTVRAAAKSFGKTLGVGLGGLATATLTASMFPQVQQPLAKALEELANLLHLMTTW